MPIDVRWLINRSVSCFHACEAISCGRAVVDARLTAALAGPVGALEAECLRAEAPIAQFFGHLIPLAEGIEAHHDQTAMALKRTVLPVTESNPTEETVSRVAAALAEVKHAYTALYPDLLDELELRSGPLREQFEARGPGLLFGFERRTEAGLVPEAADALLVSPALGGGGAAHLAYNTVRIEAVLANPHAELPETVRLAWFLSQLNCDVPRHSENLSPETRSLVIALATLPGVLEAAADVELLRPEMATLARALELWQPAEGDSARFAEPLAAWWKTYCQRRPRWSVALGALETMIVT